MSFKRYLHIQNNAFNFQIHCQIHHTFSEPILCIEMYLFQYFSYLLLHAFQNSSKIFVEDYFMSAYELNEMYSSTKCDAKNEFM